MKLLSNYYKRGIFEKKYKRKYNEKHINQSQPKPRSQNSNYYLRKKKRYNLLEK